MSSYKESEQSTFSLKWISTNFPKRLLLLFRTVLAFPKASNRGFAAGGESRVTNGQQEDAREEVFHAVKN